LKKDLISHPSQFYLNKKLTYLIVIGIIALCFCLLINLMAGSANISLAHILDLIIWPNSNDSDTLLVQDIRLPKTLTALMTGFLLAQCGLLMQTYFQNPLAGPYVLGISSGASLGAALFLMSPFAIYYPTLQHIGVVGFAFLGAAVVTVIVLMIALRNTGITVILIIGLLINYFISSLQSIIEYYASANNLKNFNTWLFGNLNSVSLAQLNYLIPIGLIISVGFLLLSKPLNTLAVGKTNAIALGLNYKRFSIAVIVLTSLTTAIVTAYCGPISFIGMIVPFTIRWITKSNNHFLLFICSGIYGACTLLLSDFLSYKLIHEQYIPVNIILGMIGIPIIVLYLIRNKFIAA
jgi:iron complex transport system permease protein